MRLRIFSQLRIKLSFFTYPVTKRFGKKVVDSAIEARKKTTTTSNKSDEAISEFTKQETGSQTVTRNVAKESLKRGGAGGVGATAFGEVVLDSNSGSDNKGSRASASSKPSGSRGVRYNKVAGADVARVR